MLQTLGYIPGFFISRIALSWTDLHLVHVQVEASDQLVLEHSRGSFENDHVRICVHQHTGRVSLVQKLKTAKEAAIISVSCKNDDNVCVSGLIHDEIFAGLFQQGHSKYKHASRNQKKRA